MAIGGCGGLLFLLGIMFIERMSKLMVARGRVVTVRVLKYGLLSCPESHHETFV